MQPDKAGTAPVFPADHFAGTKADRVMATKDGLTAWEAIQRLFPEPEPEHMIKSDIQLWAGGHTWVDTEMWWTNAVLSFQDLLRNDSWYAKGCRVPVDPTPRSKRIHPDLWDILVIDPDNNTASGGGLEFAGLRFYEKKKVETSISREPVRRADLRRFMEQRIAHLKEAGDRSNAREDETAARKHFKDRSVSRAWIKELRDEFDVPENWSTRGRRN